MRLQKKSEQERGCQEPNSFRSQFQPLHILLEQICVSCIQMSHCPRRQERLARSVRPQLTDD